MLVSSSRSMLNKILNKIRLPFRKEKELYLSLYRILGFYPRHIELYKQALCHRSIGRRNEKGKPLNNERLEFLGDAILDAVVGDIVYRHFEGKPEGFLTNTRSKIVQRETLGQLAKEMGLNKLIISSGKGFSHNSYMGGNAFEALVGAIYLDQGYEACMDFMKKRVLSRLINIDKVAYKEINFKSKLLEWCQKNKVSLVFRLVDEKKEKNNSPTFVYEALIEGVQGGTGKGYSKKESQQMASKEALQRLRHNPKFIDSVFAAKSDRTKMEEMPVSVAPSTEQQNDFIIAQDIPAPEEKVLHVPSKGRRVRVDAQVLANVANDDKESSHVSSHSSQESAKDNGDAPLPKEQAVSQKSNEGKSQDKSVIAKNAPSVKATKKSVAEESGRNMDASASDSKGDAETRPEKNVSDSRKGVSARRQKNASVNGNSSDADSSAASSSPSFADVKDSSEKPARKSSDGKAASPKTASRRKQSKAVPKTDDTSADFAASEVSESSAVSHASTSTVEEQTASSVLESKEDGDLFVQSPVRGRRNTRSTVKKQPKEVDEFDLSDITATPKQQTREEIIAAAEAAAFGEQE